MSNVTEEIAGETDGWPMSANTMRSISLWSAGLAGGDFVITALCVSKAFNDPNVQMFFGKIGTPIMGALGACAAATVAVVFSKVAARKTMEEAIQSVSEKKDATASVSNNPDVKPV